MPRPSVCIKVPKRQGEKTIILVTKLGLADKSLVIQREEENLCIPIGQGTKRHRINNFEKSDN